MKNIVVRCKFPSPKQAPNLFPMVYAPELYISLMIYPLLASYYQSQIGFFIWIVDLVWVDINNEVLVLDSCLVLPQEVNIEVVFHFYG